MEDTLGKRISANRKCMGMTQDQLAEQLGVTAQAVSKWENDQSCPDISILPRLAQIFGISTDELLGCAHSTQTVHEAQVVADDAEPEGIHIQKGNWEFSLDRSKRGALQLAVLVILVGVLYLLSELLHWGASFWELLWPSGFLVFGVFGLLRRFSFVSLGSVLVGGFYLADELIPSGLNFDGGMVFAVIVVLLGLSLLIDALRNKKKRNVHMHWNWEPESKKRGKTLNNIVIGEDSFEFDASFGQNQQMIAMKMLRQGQINTSFGEYQVDLSGVEELDEHCQLEVSNSIGELTLLVPRRFQVKPASSTAFASFNVEGQPLEEPTGTIGLDLNVSFGEVTVRYI